jgi:hypothetical protein
VQLDQSGLSLATLGGGLALAFALVLYYIERRAAISPLRIRAVCLMPGRVFCRNRGADHPNHPWTVFRLGLGGGPDHAYGADCPT